MKQTLVCQEDVKYNFQKNECLLLFLIRLYLAISSKYALYFNFMLTQWSSIQCRIHEKLKRNLYTNLAQNNKDNLVYEQDGIYFTRKFITNRGGSVACGGKGRSKVQIHFPPNSLSGHNIHASVCVLPKDDFSLSRNPQRQLAGPVVCLGPTGSIFKKNVEVTIPIFKDIHKKKGQRLKLYCEVSETDIWEEPVWKEHNTKFKFKWHKKEKQWTVTFYVGHFSLYNLLVNVVDNVAPNSIKVFSTSYLSGLTFLTHFNAYMTDCNDKRQFGLCVVASPKPSVFRGKKVYPLHVGWCTPCKIKSGKLEIRPFEFFLITLRLKSQLFKVNESVGECAGGLSKTVHYFGIDIDVQYSCVITNENTIPEMEIFGKLSIYSIDDDGNEIEETSFNLVKQQQCEKAESQNQVAAIGLEHPKYFNHTTLNTQQVYNEQPTFVETQFNSESSRKRTFTYAFPNDGKSPDTCILDDLSRRSCVSKNWRTLGRNLNLSENSINFIDTNFDSETEKAYQMFQEWREQYPDEFTCGTLRQVFHRCGMKDTARLLTSS